MSTNVPKIVFTPTGLTVPPESAILDGVLTDWDEAFGGGMNKALETPQGQICSSEAAIIADCNAVMAELVNQIDPDTASGFMQDAIARIYFIDRIPGAPTVVECSVTGAFGTVITIGAQAQDTSGNIYVSLQQVTIPIGGTTTCQFANTADGPTPCPANTLNRIYRAIPGWDAINNALPGILGQDVETQAAFAYRRAQSVALNAQGSLQAVYAAVFDVDNVDDVFVFENFTNAPIMVGSTDFVMSPHSLLVSVVGGTDTDVANAIFTKKSPGCDMNGNTPVTVTDTSGYDPPFPEYPITFERPDPLPILFEVNITDSDSLPSNITDLVKAAIIDTFNGTTVGSTRVRIGSLLLASKFYRGILDIGPEVSLLSVFVGTMTADQTSILIGVDQAPTVQASDIVVNLV
jgi:uncharacterized phage protein gp47/JayE